MTNTISILDCGMGNIGSVANMLRHLKVPVRVITTADEVLAADKLLLPGVGHWDNGIRCINQAGVRQALDEAVLVQRTPVLGICLGMQMLLESSEEGSMLGLGWIPGRVCRFDAKQSMSSITKLRIPHMGWNVTHYDDQAALAHGFSGEFRFYYVHSYHAVEVAEAHVFMHCHYGYDFACGIRRDNIWGVQFHPEKSHRFGMQLLKNFAEIPLC